MVVFQTILVVVLTFSPLCGGQKTRFLRQYSVPQDAVIGSSFTFNWTYVLVASDTLDFILLQYTTSSTPLLFVASDGTADYSRVPASYKGRITWTGDLKKSVVSLVLSNIKLGDETSYNIKIKYNSFNHLQNSVILKVLEPAYFTGPPLLNQSLTEGQDLTLKCEAGGRPQPNITWVEVFNGQVVQKGKGSSTLQINKIARPSSLEVSYVYECQAVNIHGTAAIKKKIWITVQYKAKIDRASSSANKSSYIGQTVTLTCVAEGVPVPTLKWTKPDGSPLKPEEQSNSIAVDVDLKREVDFGTYKCSAKNVLVDDVLTIYIDQLKKPGPPTITSTDEDIQATSLTVRWNPPIDNGGSFVTGYKAIVREQGSKVVKNVSIGNVQQQDFGNLKISTIYILEVSAINVAGEGRPGTKSITTKFEGAPEAAEFSITNTSNLRKFEIRWTKPKDNRSPITSYTIYTKLILGNGNEETWVKKQTVRENMRSYVVTLEAGKTFKIVVTASNKFGEAKKEENRVKTIIVPKSPYPASSTVKTQTLTSATTNIEAGTSHSESCSCEKIHIAYGVVIALLVLIIVAQCFLICWRNHGNQKHTSLKCSACSGKEIPMDPILSTNNSVIGKINPSADFPNTAAGSPAPPSEYMPLVPRNRSWELNRSNINVIKIIGKGAFSKVGKATATGIRGVEREMMVAVKMLKENAPSSDRKDLLAELELMKTFKPHPHVIKLLGCVTESEPPMVIIEYVPYGDLLGYLRKSRGLNDTYYKNPDVKPRTDLTSQQLMSFAWQIADGMNFLASKKVIHRDLAARNVLVGEGEKCKVTDFGMARDVHQDDIYTKRSRGRLPVKWTAYESLLYGVYTTQSDVWSYGVVLYEIFTIGGRPYPNMDGRRIAARLQEGYRMPKPAHLEDRLYCIMTDCWKENPSERPTFSEMKGIMAKMERNHRTYINLKEYDSSLYANVDDIV